jgi:hypothetical protein
MSQNHSSLGSLYQQELQPILTRLEEQRVRVRNQALTSGAIAIVAVIIMSSLLWLWIREIGIIISLIIGMIVWVFINTTPQKTYRTHFKEQVIERLVRYAAPTLRYYHSRGITESEFRSSRIYRRRIDSYRCEDLIEGILGATTFCCSEVHAKYKTQTTDSKGKTKTRWHTLFRGIFFIADFNKSFNGLTLVIPDVAERTLGGLGKIFQEWGANLGGQPGQLVKLEDPEFERIFAVYATDQVEARYILSTSLMQRLVQFHHRMNARISLSFVNSCVYVAIPTRKNYFEPPSIWTGSAQMTLKEIQAYLEDIQLAEGIIDDLSLNTRIWTR